MKLKIFFLITFFALAISLWAKSENKQHDTNACVEVISQLNPEQVTVYEYRTEQNKSQ